MIFGLCAFLILASLCATNASLCGDWDAIGDKCYKIIENTILTFDDAQNACKILDDSSNLPISRTRKESKFLADYLLKSLDYNPGSSTFWIGAKCSTNKRFHWIDGTRLRLGHWNRRGYRRRANYCVQMLLDESVLGRWMAEPCKSRSLVVCERSHQSNHQLGAKNVKNQHKSINLNLHVNLKDDQGKNKNKIQTKNLIKQGPYHKNHRKRTKTQVKLNLNINKPKDIEFLIKHRNIRELIQKLKNEAQNRKQVQLVQLVERFFNQIMEQIESRVSDSPMNVALKIDDLDRTRSLIYSEESRELVRKVKDTIPEEQFNNLSIVALAIRQGIDSSQK